MKIDEAALRRIRQERSTSQYATLVEAASKVQANPLDSPSVYVGTYQKYNEGNLFGKWLNLEEFPSKEDFLKAAKELHKDEADPELMFQDYSGFPEAYYGESHLDDGLWDWLALDEEERNLLAAYVEMTGDDDASIRDARNAYLGTYDSEEDWAYEFLQETGGLSPSSASSYLYITDLDRRLIAQEEADHSVEDMEEGPERDEAWDEAYEKVFKALEDPVGYFVDDLGAYSIEDLMKSNLVQVDYEKYARDASYNGDISFVKKDGKTWVFSNH